MTGRLWKALACCRRIALLLGLALSLLGAFVYWQMPPLSALKPDIERYLKQQLRLSHLEIRDLSWYWAGHLWVRADGIAFESPYLNYRHGEIGIRIPFLRLLLTDFMPNRIRMRGGTLQLHLPEGGRAGSGLPPLPDTELLLDRVALDWNLASHSGHIDYVSLTLDKQRRIAATTPQLTLAGQLDPDMAPQTLSLTIMRLDWVPQDILRFSGASPRAHLEIRRLKPRQWSVQAEMAAADGGFVLWPQSRSPIPVDRLKLAGRIDTDSQWTIRRIALDAIHWRHRRDAIEASLNWQEGVLQLHARAPRLAMPLMWHGLHPLDDTADWHAWLDSMHQGAIRQAVADVRLQWAEPWTGWPTSAELDSMQYTVHGEVEGADLALGTAGDVLTGVDADVEVNASGLHAKIRHAQLPHHAGTVEGKLAIAWDTLMLDIQGQGRVELVALAKWQSPELLKLADWQRAASHADFAIRWPAASASPESVRIRFTPRDPWQLNVRTIPLSIAGGEVTWDLRQGIRAKQLDFATEFSRGRLDFSATQDGSGQWMLGLLDASFETDLAAVVRQFEIPIAGAGGHASTRIRIADQRIEATLDLANAEWQNLLGTDKQRGAALRVSAQGEIRDREEGWGLSIRDIRTPPGQPIQLQGRGELDSQGLMLNLDRLQTGAFNGTVLVQAPFGPARWTLDVDARYLDRSALPDTLPKAAKSKEWELAARIDRFNWGEAALNGVHLKLDSHQKSVGTFTARHVHTSKLDLTNLKCAFILPGNGLIDVLELTSDVGKHHLFLSATLQPETDGALAWRGFAEVTGNFGQLMQQGELSRRFLNGRMHALFAGQGVFMRERPWWQGLNGRLRLRVDNGRILEGGVLTRLLALLSLADLPKILLGQREDLVGPGLMYKRLQMEGILNNEHFNIYNLAMRATALDMAGRGSVNLASNEIDLLMIVHPLQNLDAILNKIPLLRDILGDRSHSLLSRVYRMKGPLEDAKIERATPKESEIALNKIVEGLFSLPEQWFGKEGASPK